MELSKAKHILEIVAYDEMTGLEAALVAIVKDLVARVEAIEAKENN